MTRVPLTTAQIERLYHNAPSEIVSSFPSMAAFIRAFRFFEAVHQIGEAE